MGGGRVVLVDTNIIIEAVRTDCWAAIAGHDRIETVDYCRVEARSGDRERVGYTPVSEEQLGRLAAAHQVTTEQLVRLRLACPDVDGLDVGERELWAHALRRNDDWVASCSDRAAVRVACKLGWGDRLLSLEEVAKAAGARPTLKRHFTTAWLSEWRTRFLLEGGQS